MTNSYCPDPNDALPYDGTVPMLLKCANTPSVTMLLFAITSGPNNIDQIRSKLIALIIIHVLHTGYRLDVKQGREIRQRIVHRQCQPPFNDSIAVS